MPTSHGQLRLFARPSGTGSSCRAATPCALAEAWKRARSGTVIVLRGGRYGLLDVEQRSFDPRNPVTMRGARGQTATFVGSAARPTLNAVAFVDCRGIRISHITIAAPDNISNLKISTSQHVEVDHVVSRDAGIRNPQGGNGILVVSEPGHAYHYSDDVQIWDSSIYNWGLNTQTAGAGKHGIYYGAHGARNGVIANNILYDGPAGFGLQLGGDASNTIVTNNTIVDIRTPAAGAGSAIVVWNDGYNLGTNHNVIVNNILADNVAYGVAAVGDLSDGNVVRNNLSYANGRGGYAASYGSNVVFSVKGPQYQADPRFVGAARHDYHLRPGSPARGKADPAYAPRYDAAGKLRGPRPALGAFQPG
jgi:hypothetical protein